MPESSETSPLTLNRLSVYLRCLRDLQEQGLRTVSSRELAERYHLSPAQIRKDLAQFGEFGVRGVGYEVEVLADRIHGLLGLDVCHRLIIVGMGLLGSALARYPGFNDDSFSVVAIVDKDVAKTGEPIGMLSVAPLLDLEEIVRATGADIGVIRVPATAAQETVERLVSAGVRSILNFAPVLLKSDPDVRLRNADLRVHLEEIGFFLQSV